MKEFIAVHLLKEVFYNQAQHIVAVDEKTVDETVWIFLQF
jgi:shikimate kinase